MERLSNLLSHNIQAYWDQMQVIMKINYCENDTRAVLKTHFIWNLWIGPIICNFTSNNWAGIPCEGQTLQLIGPIHKLWRKWSVVNMILVNWVYSGSFTFITLLSLKRFKRRRHCLSRSRRRHPEWNGRHRPLAESGTLKFKSDRKNAARFLSSHFRSKVDF